MKVTKTLMLFWVGAAGSPAQISNFQHIIVIVQENRTPDNLFQGLCTAPYGSIASCSTAPNSLQYDIQIRNWLDKDSIVRRTQPAPVPLANKYDLGHSHTDFVNMCDMNLGKLCKMDGAGDILCNGTCPTKPQFAYVENSNNILGPYLQLALQYGWANYMFQTNQGPSFPAHQFLFGGTSAPTPADDAQGIFASENTSSTVAGCIAPQGTTVMLIDRGGENKAIYPCFEHQTMADVLPASATWKYYTPSAGSIWTAPNAIQHICQSNGYAGECTGEAWKANVDLGPAHILTDIQDCKLRSLSWVVPTADNSDHAGVNDGGGPSWVASIVNAIGNSSSCDAGRGYWKDTAIFITWDDWGGWYDHVPPTFLANPQGDYEYGFRVPLIVASAYTPTAYVDNERHDFGSLLRFIEQNFGIQQGVLNFADARSASNLSEFFDLHRTARPFQTIAAPKDAKFFINDPRPPTDPDDQ